MTDRQKERERSLEGRRREKALEMVVLVVSYEENGFEKRWSQEMRKGVTQKGGWGGERERVVEGGRGRRKNGGR